MLGWLYTDAAGLLTRSVPAGDVVGDPFADAIGVETIEGLRGHWRMQAFTRIGDDVVESRILPTSTGSPGSGSAQAT